MDEYYLGINSVLLAIISNIIAFYPNIVKIPYTHYVSFLALLLALITGFKGISKGDEIENKKLKILSTLGIIISLPVLISYTTWFLAQIGIGVRIFRVI